MHDHHHFASNKNLGDSAQGGSVGARRAISLHTTEAGRLCIHQGRAWVTVNMPHVVGGLGDHVLHAGQGLDLPAGAHVVLEAWSGDPDRPSGFDWGLQALARPRRFERDVLRPSRALVQNLRQAGAALFCLLQGLIGYAEVLVAGRGRVLSRWESNPP